MRTYRKLVAKLGKRALNEDSNIKIGRNIDNIAYANNDYYMWMNVHK